MLEALATMMMAVLVLAVGFYGALRWIVLDGEPVRRDP
jgi:hypothetical protein